MHKIESRYMKTFWITMWISAPAPLMMYSLDTPANTEHRHFYTKVILTFNTKVTLVK